MNQGVGMLAAIILIWYLSLFYGCLDAHQPDASLNDPPNNGELEQSFRSVTCLSPQPTVKGVVIAIVLSLTAGYLGLND